MSKIGYLGRYTLEIHNEYWSPRDHEKLKDAIMEIEEATNTYQYLSKEDFIIEDTIDEGIIWKINKENKWIRQKR